MSQNDDSISRQAAIDAPAKAMPSWTTPDGSGEFDHDIQITDETFVDCMQIINELPSVQPDIIRCKDCKHWNPQLKTANGNGLGSCDFHNVALVTSEGFCYWAERGEQNDSEAD